jgi:V/A-type H+-transporting ATPase subunit I
MLRPVRTRWFELLVARDALAPAVGVLARTGRVELEPLSDVQGPLCLPHLQALMDEYQRLARRYHTYWPKTGLRSKLRSARPTEVLTAGLEQLRAWEQVAAPRVQELESCTAEQAELRLVQMLITRLQEPLPDLALFESAGPALGARLFVFPPGVESPNLPGSLVQRWAEAGKRRFLLALGTAAELAALQADLSEAKGRVVALPAGLHGDRAALLAQLKQRLRDTDRRSVQLGWELAGLGRSHGLARVLPEIRLLEWFMSHVSGLPSTDNFAWVSGWTDDLDGQRLHAELARAGVAALLHLTEPPRDADPPLILRNPAWARPFELFTRMLGTPGSNEADPSPLVAVLAPLLFGYMFGDVGQGLVLVAAGLLLRRRWPVFGVLVVNGLAAVMFGFLFGSVFGREDLIAPLWVHPIQHPGEILLVPLAAGAVIMLIGLLLYALEMFWRGQLRRWWLTDAALLVLYVSILAAPFASVAAGSAVVALLWYVTGSLLCRPGKLWLGLLAAFGTLFETILQLLMNTLSFVRVGAFALAHAGLSLAFNTLAAATDHAMVSLLLLLLGNLVVILLEGLVVTVQTTRLILFEFFIRFLQGSGRVFRPLAAPRFES